MNETSFYPNQILWRANAILNKTGIDRAQCEKTQTSRACDAFATTPSTEKRDLENHTVAVEFEAIFLKELLKIMRKTVPKSGFLNGGWTEEFYWDMLNQELSECIAHAGGIGLARMIYQQLTYHPNKVIV